MKRFILVLVLAVLVYIQNSTACTTFFINKNGQLIFGRNYDWVSGAGMVCTNLRGLSKTSFPVPDGGTVTWVSRYGSISFNQYGKELPTGGMNEKGLVVELMWADGSQYPAADKRPAMEVLQWVQYQLDNSAVIDDVIASDKQVRISRHSPPLHYLVADANGNAATIEFFNGQMIVHKGKDLPFPVLANSPYEQSAKVATDAQVLTGNTSFSFNDNSLQRFTKACSMVQQYNQSSNNKPGVNYAFDILDKVAQQGFTKWSIVYDIKNKAVHFRTADYRDIKSFTFNAFDFNCAAGSKMVNMNQFLKGNINNQFIPFSNDLNREVTEQAIEESSSRVPISDKEKEDIFAYANSIKCKE